MAKSQGGDQLARDARIALPILGLLILLFVATAYRRFSGWGDPPPASIQETQPETTNGSSAEDSIVPPVLRRDERDEPPTTVDPVADPRSPQSGNPARLQIPNPRRNQMPAATLNAYPPRQDRTVNTLSPPPQTRLDGQRQSIPNGVSVRVEVDDSYWTLSERAYGTGQYFRALHQYAQDHPALERELLPGRTVSLPTAAELQRRYPLLRPDEAATGPLDYPSSRDRNRIYTTQGQETLFELAARFLGQASRYTEILTLNRTTLPRGTGANDPLPAGMQIVLPAQQ